MPIIGGSIVAVSDSAVRVHVYGRPVDMRKSFDGLYVLTRQALGWNMARNGLEG